MSALYFSSYILLLFLAIPACRTVNDAQLSGGTIEAFSIAADVSSVYDTIERYNEQTATAYSERKSKAYVVKIASFNTGLLHSALRVIGKGSVPNYYERRAELKRSLVALVTTEAPIFICLQELFYAEDAALVEQFATEKGYGIMRFANASETGVTILYRQRNLQADAARSYSESTFSVVVEDENFMDRAVIGGVFRLNNGTAEGIRILVATAHLSFALGEKENRARLAQIEKMTTLLKQKAEESNVDAVMLGADFNLSPVVGSHVYASGKPVRLSSDQIKLWSENTKGYTSFYNLMLDFKMIDTWFAANPLPESLKLSVVVDDNDIQRPFVGFTEDPMKSYLTRTGSTTRDEPAQRLDLIWSGTRAGSNGERLNTHILGSKIIFAKPLFNDKGEAILTQKQPLHLSDHFGVLSTVALFR